MLPSWPHISINLFYNIFLRQTKNLGLWMTCLSLTCLASYSENPLLLIRNYYAKDGTKTMLMKQNEKVPGNAFENFALILKQ